MADVMRATSGTINPAELRGEIQPLVDQLVAQCDTLLAAKARAHIDDIAASMVEKGAETALAAQVARLFALDGAIGLAALSRDTGIAPVALAQAFVELGSLLGVDWAQAQAAIMRPSDPWERLLVAGLARDFQQMRMEFLRRQAQQAKGKKTDPAALTRAWAERHDSSIAQFRRVIARAQGTVPVAPAMLAQVASQARNLLQS